MKRKTLKYPCPVKECTGRMANKTRPMCFVCLIRSGLPLDTRVKGANKILVEVWLEKATEARRALIKRKNRYDGVLAVGKYV